MIFATTARIRLKNNAARDGAAGEISDTAFAEVKRMAAIVYEMERKKNEGRE